MLALAVALALAAPPEKDPNALRIAVVNLKAVYTDSADAKANATNLATNLKRHAEFIDRAAKDGAEFVGFPELSVNGYHFSKVMTWLSLDGPEVKALRDKAAEKGVYVAAGVAEKDADGKTWNTHVVIDPKGKVIGKHRKILLTKEKEFCTAGDRHDVFEVKGLKVGIAICADGTDKNNLEQLVTNGAELIYAPHANTTGGTIAGWYKFRHAWGGEKGWIAGLKVYAVLHNHAGWYGSEFDPPTKADTNSGWSSGAWVIGPDGKTLAQMPTSTDKADCKEYMLTYSVPLPKWK